MTKRVYSVKFSGVNVSAVQDLITVFAGASMAFEVHSIQLGQTTATAIGNLPISLILLPATVTAGSGGTAPTPQKVSGTNDAAATVTAHVNDTVRSTTSGTSSTLFADVYNVLNGYQWVFPEDDRPQCGLSQAIVLSLDGAPGSAQSSSGTLVIGELI